MPDIMLVVWRNVPARAKLAEANQRSASGKAADAVLCED